MSETQSVKKVVRVKKVGTPATDAPAMDTPAPVPVIDAAATDAAAPDAAAPVVKAHTSKTTTANIDIIVGKMISTFSLDEKAVRKLLSGDLPSTSQYKKKAKNNGPKKPLSAYLFFTQEQRPLLKEHDSTMSFQDLTKALGKMWRECENRTKYVEQAEQSKKSYVQKVAENQKTPVVDSTIAVVAEKVKKVRAKKAAAPAPAAAEVTA